MVAAWIVLLLTSQGAIGSPAVDAALPTAQDHRIDDPATRSPGVGGLAVEPASSRRDTADTVAAALQDTIASLAGGAPVRLQVPLDVVTRPGIAILVGYSRYDESDPLTLETRRTLFDAVAQSPGRSLAQLSERTGVPVSTVRYHSRILADEGLVRMETIRGRHRVFPTASDHDALAAALADERARAVLAAVVEQGPLTVTQIAGTVDRAPSTVSYHLDRLEADGLVVRQRAGRAVHVSAAPAVALADGGR